ncbi:SMEK domain-containing protein [Paenibacillus fonticola]|uniref:SMEK domain-containing protein n=1 Tax=Paenibacillus fonticola TaxID=379896 RepID=UPI000366AA56|nr:SMEK domain-containing protein [Paenibacillus fonticola]
MLNRQELSKRVLECVGWLKNYIELNNVNRLNDINKYCEDFLVPVLNLTYDMRLMNLNQIKVDFPAVDLGDFDSRICYQVTSTNEIRKIEETLKIFQKKALYKDFDEINVFILGNKSGHRKQLKYEEFPFDYKKNIKDLNDLSSDILKKDTPRLKEIVDLLDREVRISPNMDNQIELLIKDELNSNFANLFRQKVSYIGGDIRLRDILNVITPDDFGTEKLHFMLLFMRMETTVYDKHEQLILDNPSEYTRKIIEIYNQFKKLNKYDDLFHMRRDEYRDLVRVLGPILNNIEVKF